MRKKFKCKSSDETNLSGRCCQLYIKFGALPKLHLWGKLRVKRALLPAENRNDPTCPPPPPDLRTFICARRREELIPVSSRKNRLFLTLKSRAIWNKRKLEGQMENEITLKRARQKTTLRRTWLKRKRDHSIVNAPRLGLLQWVGRCPSFDFRVPWNGMIRQKKQRNVSHQ